MITIFEGHGKTTAMLLRAYESDRSAYGNIDHDLFNPLPDDLSVLTEPSLIVFDDAISKFPWASINDHSNDQLIRDLAKSEHDVCFVRLTGQSQKTNPLIVDLAHDTVFLQAPEFGWGPIWLRVGPMRNTHIIHFGDSSQHWSNTSKPKRKYTRKSSNKDS